MSLESAQIQQQQQHQHHQSPQGPNAFPSISLNPPPPGITSENLGRVNEEGKEGRRRRNEEDEENRRDHSHSLSESGDEIEMTNIHPIHSKYRSSLHTNPRAEPFSPRSFASLYAIPPRRNGWQRPFHPSQLVCWTSVIACWVIYAGLILPFIPDRDEVNSSTNAIANSGGGGRSTEFWVALFIYIGLIIIGIPSYIRVQQIDPRITTEESQEYAPNELSSRSTISMTGMSGSLSPNHFKQPSCDKCQVWMGPRTKHCHLCHKCIDGFDHR
jgi:hypothetical protein